MNNDYFDPTELDELSQIGGNDDGGGISPNAATTPLCVSVSWVLLSAISVEISATVSIWCCGENP